jgi:hypothetical protein
VCSAPRTVLLLSLIVLALSACGGDERTATSTTSPPQEVAGNDASPRPHDRDGETSHATQPGSPRSQQERSEPLPPPTPGSKSAAPGVPTSKHGDNSIQRWGLEASDVERAAVTATVQRYLDARAAGNWRTVCQLLATKPRREQEQFGGGASCAKAMASFAADASPSTLREEAEIEVLSFRVGGRYAFLIYRRPDGIFATALTQEGGAWKLISVTPNPLS